MASRASGRRGCTGCIFLSQLVGSLCFPTKTKPSKWLFPLLFNEQNLQNGWFPLLSNLLNLPANKSSAATRRVGIRCVRDPETSQQVLLNLKRGLLEGKKLGPGSLPNGWFPCCQTKQTTWLVSLLSPKKTQNTFRTSSSLGFLSNRVVACG